MQQTVLIVDDSAADRRLAGGVLERDQNLKVIYASGGEEALTKIERHAADVVLTDLQMPTMNGLDLVKAIKRRYPLIPVILMTGKGSEEIAVKALQNGAASYVPKKKLADDLIETLERVLATASEDRSLAGLMNRITNHETEYVLDNDLSLIQSLVRHLRQSIQSLQLRDEVDRLRVGIALEEALLNALYHGNLEVGSELREDDPDAFVQLVRQRSQDLPYRDRRIYVKAKVCPSEAVFVIRDEGRGFDPSELPDPRHPSNLERTTGRGVLLMQTFMDEVRFNEVGNEVTLIKRQSSLSPDSA